MLLVYFVCPRIRKLRVLLLLLCPAGCEGFRFRHGNRDDFRAAVGRLRGERDFARRYPFRGAGKLGVAFRKTHPLLRYDSFLLQNGHGPQISWHGLRLGQPDWSSVSRWVAMHLSGSTLDGPADDIYLIANSHYEPQQFELPSLVNRHWRRFVDTSLEGDEAIIEGQNQPRLDNQRSYRVDGRTVVVLLSSHPGVA